MRVARTRVVGSKESKRWSTFGKMKISASILDGECEREALRINPKTQMSEPQKEPLNGTGKTATEVQDVPNYTRFSLLPSQRMTLSYCVQLSYTPALKTRDP